MQLFTWLLKRMTSLSQTRSTSARKPTVGFRPQLESLEDRIVPAFSSPASYTVGEPLAVVTADVNGDSKSDLLTLASNGSFVAVQLNNGNGTFGPVAGMIYPGQARTANAFAVGDVNGDGKPDIVFANKYGGSDSGNSLIPGSIIVKLNSGQGFVTAPVVSNIFPNTAFVSSLALADVNGDGKMDIVAVPANGGSVFVARAGVNGTFGLAQTYHVLGNLSTVPSKVAVGDLDGHGGPDIVVTVPRSNSVSVLLNNGTGTFGTAQNYAVGGAPTAIAVGDVSGDGKLDIVTTNSNGTVSVLSGQGNGLFGPTQNYAIGGPATSVALGDFNHDGRLDIVTTGGTEMDVLLENGSGGFAAYRKVGPAGSSVIAADLNGDGYADLAEIVGTNSIDVLLNDAKW